MRQFRIWGPLGIRIGTGRAGFSDRLPDNPVRDVVERPRLRVDDRPRLDETRLLPLAGTSAASLRAEHLEWRELGANIWEASLLSFEGDNAAADRLGLATLARLPAEIRTAVLGR